MFATVSFFKSLCVPVKRPRFVRTVPLNTRLFRQVFLRPRLYEQGHVTLQPQVFRLGAERSLWAAGSEVRVCQPDKDPRLAQEPFSRSGGLQSEEAAAPPAEVWTLTRISSFGLPARHSHRLHSNTEPRRQEAGVGFPQDVWKGLDRLGPLPVRQETLAGSGRTSDQFVLHFVLRTKLI